MIKNEQGNSLIIVLLVSLVFTVLGMAVVSASIGGAKRTETRESDVVYTYDALKLLNEMTSTLPELLGENELNLENFRRWDSNHRLYVENRFDDVLENAIVEQILEPNRAADYIECMNVIDVSTGSPSYLDNSHACVGSLTNYDAPFNIDKDLDFTRILDVVLVTKNPIETEGKVTRTIKKRLILSPLPSFLKYAAGSFSDNEGEGFKLNGSANFNGNVYANHLHIQEEAEFELRDGTEKTQDTPMSSITGDLYSSSANLLPLLKEDNFYKEDIPDLKHDSQFINIQFQKSMNELTNSILTDSKLSAARTGNGSDFSDSLASAISNTQPSRQIVGSDGYIEKVEVQPNPLSIVGETAAPLDNSFIIESADQAMEFNDPLKVNGDLVVMSTNYPISFLEQLVVDGDLYLVSYKDMNFNGDILATGDVHIINMTGMLNANRNIIGAKNVELESYENNVFSVESSGLKVAGDIVSGENVFLKPFSTTIDIQSNIISNKNLTIIGDENDQGGEDDQVMFDSVVYTGEKASISNVNIIGAQNNEKQIVLLVHDDLLITRINEFNNYTPADEEGLPYLPRENNTVKPLKGFFYTEKDAELYGVGSLFYIEGGLFAKEALTINAIRGRVNSITQLPMQNQQEDNYSRFIVDYNQDVLLQRIEALPIVEQLQVFSDELIVD